MSCVWTVGEEDDIQGQLWRFLGTLLPSPIDHITVYLGRGGRFIEAGPGDVVAFQVEGNSWTPQPLYNQRGQLLNTL